MNSQSPNDEIVVSRIKPQQVTSTGAVGDWVDMTLFQHVVFLFLTGAMALESLDCSIEVAEDSSGAGLAILKRAPEVPAGESSDRQIQITVGDELPVGYRYARPRIATDGASGGLASCVGFSQGGRFVHPASASGAELASVARRVA